MAKSVLRAPTTTTVCFVSSYVNNYCAAAYSDWHAKNSPNVNPEMYSPKRKSIISVNVYRGTYFYPFMTLCIDDNYFPCPNTGLVIDNHVVTRRNIDQKQKVRNYYSTLLIFRHFTLRFQRVTLKSIRHDYSSIRMFTFTF